MSVRIGSADPLAGFGSDAAASSGGRPRTRRCALGEAGVDCRCPTCEIAARANALAGSSRAINGLGDPVMIIEGFDAES